MSSKADTGFFVTLTVLQSDVADSLHRLVLSRSAETSSPRAAGRRQTPDRLYVLLIRLLGQKMCNETETRIQHFVSLQWKCLYLYISVFWSFLCFVFLSSLCLTAVYQSVYKVLRKTKTAQTDGSLQSADLRFTPHWLYHRCQTFLTLFYRRENNPPCSHRELRPHTADFDFLNVSPSLTHKLSLWHNLYHMTVIALSLSLSLRSRNTCSVQDLCFQQLRIVAVWFHAVRGSAWFTNIVLWPFKNVSWAPSESVNSVTHH